MQVHSSNVHPYPVLGGDLGKEVGVDEGRYNNQIHLPGRCELKNKRMFTCYQFKAFQWDNVGFRSGVEPIFQA